MKLPEPTPDWLDIFQKQTNCFALINSEQIREIIAKANFEYEHWERFKHHHKMPEGVSPEVVWALLKFVRFGFSKTLPVKDKIGSNFKYMLTDKILEDLNFIDKCTALYNNQISDTQKGQYLQSSLMEEAIASSQLEGAATTREKAKEMLRLGKKAADVSDQMILNNYSTILALKKMTGKEMSPSLLKDIQAMITRDTLHASEMSGRFRSDEDKICVIYKDREILFEPPAAAEIEERLQQLCVYVNEQQKEFTHPVIKAVIIHFWLAYIHPFCDGNGRTARALFYWYLIKNGYPNFEYLAISRIIKSAPAQYARAYLYSETDDNDLTYFISFNLRAVRASIHAFNLYLDKKQKEIKYANEMIKGSYALNHRQHELVMKALSYPDYRLGIKYVMTKFDVVYETARTDLLKLSKMGLLKKEKLGKELMFRAANDLSVRLMRNQR